MSTQSGRSPILWNEIFSVYLANNNNDDRSRPRDTDIRMHGSVEGIVFLASELQQRVQLNEVAAGSTGKQGLNSGKPDKYISGLTVPFGLGDRFREKNGARIFEMQLTG